jgi:glutathione S-transferase
MKLYSNPLSSNGRRVRLVAHHLGLTLDEELVDLAKGAHRQPAYLALNPNGKVPTLVDGDLKLSECYAIMIYLSEKSGKLALYPTSLPERTEVNRWLFWCANEWSPNLRKRNFELLVKPMLKLGSPDATRLQEAETEFKQHARILDGQLADRSYVLGAAISLADYALAASLATSGPVALSLAEFPNVQRWLASIEQLPAWKATAVSQAPSPQ